ncbi:MAG TPA: aspartate/glutamate racemase family protein, partial [Ignavibacteria bacterium]
WISTIEYYSNINRMINERLGGDNSAKILLYSLNFEEFRPPPDFKDWSSRAKMLTDIAVKLEKGGADCILLCANTPHIVAEPIQNNINIPLIHIAEATSKEILNQEINKVGLLGTKFTMEQSFFKEKLSKYNIETLVPEEAEREFIHSSIFNELGKEIFKESTMEKYLEIINDLISKGAQGVILGCTEIPLLIKPGDCEIPTFDTTLIHSKAAVDFALS